MSVQDIFIGADGGGTKTKVLIEDAAGRELGVAKTGPGNIRSSVAGAWSNINEGIQEALKQASIDLRDPNYRFHVGLGLAGTEVKEAREAFLKMPHPYHSLVLDSDAYVACLGVHGGEDGAIIIVGTGVVALQIEGNKRVAVGGWGFPHGDEGGGAWFGMEATRLTCKAIDGRIPFSPLLKAIYERFHEDASQLVSWAVNARPGDFGTLAPMVMQFLDQQDENAKALVVRAGEEINLVAAALARQRMNSEAPVRVGLLGGIAPFVKPYLPERLKAVIVPRKFDAPKGAILMIRKWCREQGIKA